MYICICNAVTERDICVAAARGAATIDDLTMHLGVGAGCGGCREGAEAVLKHCGRTTPCDGKHTHAGDSTHYSISRA